MKKIKIELKYIMIVLVVIAGVLLAISGNFSETKTMTAYKTTVNGSDSARVAKWDVIGLTRKNGVDLSFAAGFSKQLKSSDDNGSWYFDIKNSSEVVAQFSDDSRIELRLLHSNFDNDDNTPVTWWFLGTENPVNFTITAYPGSAEDLLTYQHKTDETVIKYSTYKGLEEAQKANYEEIFYYEDGDNPETDQSQQIVLTKKDLQFSKTFDSIDGTYYYSCSISLSTLTEVLKKIPIGSSVTFKVEWTVGETSGSTCSHKDTNPKDNVCDVCNNLINIVGEYYKYIVSKTDDPIEGYERIDEGNSYIDPSVDPSEESNVRYLFRSTNKVEFYEYQKYTSTLGGEPLYEFATVNTQTMLIGHSALSAEQKAAITDYVYSSTNNDVQKAWEYYTYQEYDLFLKEYEATQNSQSYLGYGAKLQIVFDLSVEQVD